MDKTTEALVESIQKIATSIEEDRVKQVPFHKAKIPTAFNPTGSRNRPRLTRPLWFNGAPIDPSFLTDEEIGLANQLKAGRYHDRQWQVIERDQDPNRPVEVRVTDATIADRMNLYKTVPSFADLCKQIIAEAATRKTVVEA